MPKSKRKELTGRGTVDKEAVVGMKDRKTNRVKAEATRCTDKETLQGSVVENTTVGGFAEARHIGCETRF